MTRLTGHAVRDLVFGRVGSGARYDIEAVERLRARVAVTLETWTLRRDAVQKGHATPVAKTALLSSDAVQQTSLPLAAGDDPGYVCADVDRFVRRATEAIAQAARSFHTEAVVASRLGVKSPVCPPDVPAQPDLPAATPRQEDTHPARMALATAVVTVVALLGISMAPERESGSDVVEPRVRDSEQAAVTPRPESGWSPGGRMGSRQELMGAVPPSAEPEVGALTTGTPAAPLGPRALRNKYPPG